MTRAAREIDRVLQSDPEEPGESRPGGQRILIIAPLGVIYRIYEQDRIVQVLNVWRFRTPDDR